jgi:hypothetical protein
MIGIGPLEQVVLQLTSMPSTQQFRQSFSTITPPCGGIRPILVAILKLGTWFHTRSFADHREAKLLWYSYTSCLGDFCQYSDLLQIKWLGLEFQHSTTGSDLRFTVIFPVWEFSASIVTCYGKVAGVRISAIPPRFQIYSLQLYFLSGSFLLV